MPVNTISWLLPTVIMTMAFIWAFWEDDEPMPLGPDYGMNATALSIGKFIIAAMISLVGWISWRMFL